MGVLSKVARRLNPIPDGLADEVFERDRYCFMKRLDPNHRCRDRMGTFHKSDNRRKLTLEHVKPQLGLAMLKKHKVWLIVALCGYENNRPPTKQTRYAMRTYLATIYPEQWAMYKPSSEPR